MSSRGLATLIFICFLACSCTLGQAISREDGKQLFEKGKNLLLSTQVKRDDLHAVEYLRRAADMGYAPAQVALGSLYQSGTIVTREPREALDWYKKAADQDDPLAEWLAGSLIFSGEVGIRDLNEAATWFQKSAQHGDPFGQYLLGMVKLERKDYKVAIEWLRRAAAQGLPQARLQVGTLLREGPSGTQNKFEAYTWLLSSFQSGNQSVADDLQSLEADLGSSKVEEAKSKVSEMGSRSAMAHGCTGWPGELKAIPDPPPVDTQRFCRE